MIVTTTNPAPWTRAEVRRLTDGTLISVRAKLNETVRQYHRALLHLEQGEKTESRASAIKVVNGLMEFIAEQLEFFNQEVRYRRTENYLIKIGLS